MLLRSSWDDFVQDAFDNGLGSHTDAADTHMPSRRLPPEGRQGDLLSLVFGMVSAEDLPRPTASRLARGEYARKILLWVMLMIAMLNFHYNLGHPALAGSLRSGPPTEPQYAALVRLHTAADMMVELNPGSLDGVDWETEVGKSKIGLLC